MVSLLIAATASCSSTADNEAATSVDESIHEEPQTTASLPAKQDDSSRTRGTDIAGDSELEVATAPRTLWVSDSSASRVIRIDAASGEVVTSVEIGGRVELLINDRSHIWMADNTNDQVLVFDSVTSRMGIPLAIGDKSVAMVATSDAVWIAGGAGDVFRIPVSTTGDPEIPASAEPLDSLPLGPGETIVGFGVLDDQPWVVGSDGTIVGLEPLTGQATTTVETGLQVSKISRSGDTIWVGSSSGVLSQVDLTTLDVTMVVEPAGLFAPHMLEVEGESLWVSNLETLFHLDASNGEIITSFELAPEFAGIGVSPEMVWLTYPDSIVGMNPTDGHTLMEVKIDGASLGVITLS